MKTNLHISRPPKVKHKSEPHLKTELVPTIKSRISFNTPKCEINEEIKLVEKLEFWNYNKVHNSLTRTNTARESLERKLKKQDIVEAHLRERKLGSQKNQILTSKEKAKYYNDYEKECFDSYSNIKLNLNSQIEARDRLRQSIIDLRNEVEKEKRKLAEIEKQKLNPVKLGLAKSPQESISFITGLIKRKNTMLKAIEDAQEELSQNIKMIQFEVESKTNELIAIEKRIETLRKEAKLVKEDIIEYLLKILKEGTDTNGEGLYSTVKYLLKFNIDLKNNYFPNVLDEESVNCIVKIAQKHLELDDSYEKLLNSYMHLGTSSFTPINIQNRLANLKKTIKIRKPDCSYKKQKKWQMQEMLNISKDTFVAGISEGARLEEKIQKIKEEIRQVQENEIRRLTKKCIKSGQDIKMFGDYIVGVDNLVKFKVVIMKEIQSIDKIKEKTRTFSFTDYLVPRPKVSIIKEKDF